jgi:hypothetical protein
MQATACVRLQRRAFRQGDEGGGGGGGGGGWECRAGAPCI